LSNQYSVLGRHRLHKVGESAPPAESTAQLNTATKPTAPNAQQATEEAASISSMGIPQFLKRMSMGILSK
jgi:hypothetical protein